MEGGEQPRAGRRLTILMLMGFIAAAGVGLWLVAPDLRGGEEPAIERGVLALVAVLGGFSLLGPVVLLAGARRKTRRGRPYGPGEVIWFAQGMAAWLLWPPVIFNRIEGRRFSDTMSGPCYYYGTPLMAIYVTTALLAGGWIRRRRWGRTRSWRETFGLLLAAAWACTGFYLLYQLYRQDFKF